MFYIRKTTINGDELKPQKSIYRKVQLIERSHQKSSAEHIHNERRTVCKISGSTAENSGKNDEQRNNINRRRFVKSIRLEHKHCISTKFRIVGYFK